MNPHTVIRPWLIAVGSLTGIREAHEYRWSDASTRQNVEYFTYQVMSMLPEKTTPQNYHDSEGYTLKRISQESYITTVQIDLHRSENGMVELAQCAIAARDKNENIKAIFRTDSCDFRSCVKIENLTESQDDEFGLSENYHHRMIVEFYDNIRVEFSEENEIVEDIVIIET